ncbi:TAP domain-containing protein [Thozetella sp. PMI_491]|nr:TAP domain-containing protein [Thozetella sp. PMI_491]
MASTQTVSGQIQWQGCTDINYNTTATMLCGNLSVPFDYTNQNTSSKLTLRLIKFPATQSPSNGSILFNFGGPEEPDRLEMAQNANTLLNMTGGIYDLISFETRGTGSTLPFLCWDNDVDRALFFAMSPGAGRASDTALGAQWAAAEILANTCYEKNINRTGELVGTAFVARDIMQIVDALDEGGFLRYWGFSYGTLLGATVAAMFPDRVDKVILDGVVNPHEYYHGYDIQKYADTDKVFHAFVNGCVSSPEQCALASGNVTAAELKHNLLQKLNDLKYNPIVLGSSIVDYSRVQSTIATTLYFPALWPVLSVGLHGVLTENATEVEILDNALAGRTDSKAIEYLAGIECSDKTARATKRSEIAPFVDQLFKTPAFSDIQTNVFAWCANWKMEAKERYSGDFHVKTRNPILLIGNTFDPATPLVSARNVSAGFEGSVVLQHNGHGHTSRRQPSSCTVKYIQEYFANGTLPSPGTICQPDLPLFHVPVIPGDT